MPYSAISPSEKSSLKHLRLFYWKRTINCGKKKKKYRDSFIDNPQDFGTILVQLVILVCESPPLILVTCSFGFRGYTISWCTRMEGLLQSSSYAIHSVLGSIFPAKEIEKPVIIREIQQSMQPGSRAFVRVAGLSGALAVVMSAYGAHGKLC